MSEIHTIPVPVGWSAEQAWEAISRGEVLEHPNGEPDWTNVEVVDGRLVRWFPADEEAGRG
jgi:hypothetical protein